MKKQNLQNVHLLILLAILLAGTLSVHILFRKSSNHPAKELMQEAVSLHQNWMQIIADKKQELNIKSAAYSNVPNKALLGNDWSEITSTLGTLEAKELTTHPDFAALMVKLIIESGVQKNRNVGVMLSGSFPALALASFAALQTLDMQAVIVSSVGASSYGANQLKATWLDYETWLRKNSEFRYKSNLVTRGAEDDAGNGLLEEGIASIDSAAARNGFALFIPENLRESIQTRMKIFNEANIELLINIGGGQAAMGSCAHNSSIPNGLHLNYEACTDTNRGVISRLSEQNVPFIHLLHIKDLAVQNGIPIASGKFYAASTGLYESNRINKSAVVGLLMFSFLGLLFLRKKKI